MGIDSHRRHRAGDGDGCCLSQQQSFGEQMVSKVWFLCCYGIQMPGLWRSAGCALFAQWRVPGIVQAKPIIPCRLDIYNNGVDIEVAIDVPETHTPTQCTHRSLRLHNMARWHHRLLDFKKCFIDGTRTSCPHILERGHLVRKKNN